MTWRFEPAEGLRDAFRRVSAEEIAKVRAGLSGAEEERDEAIHEARQSFKRLRALVRLAKPPLGSDFAAENRRWRDAGRLLSGSRDTTVLLKCFDAIAGDCAAEQSAHAVRRLRARLAGKTGNGGEHVEEKLREVLALLDDAEASMAELDWPNSRNALLHGFRRAQKRLRRDWKTACASGEPEALHSWRKRVKDQASQLRLFRNVVPAAFRKRIADQKATAEHLGDEHDLWLLSDRLRDESIPGSLFAARDALLEQVEKHRGNLRKKAYRRGESFSSQKARDFSEEIGLAWDKALAHLPKELQRAKRPQSTTSPQR